VDGSEGVIGMMESIEKLRKSSHLDDDKWTLETGEAFGPIADKLPIPDYKEPHELCLSWEATR